MTGSVGQRKPEVGSGGNRNLENWRETRNRPGLERRVEPAHRFRLAPIPRG